MSHSTLLSTVRLSLDPFHREKIRLIDAEDFEGVKTRAQKTLQQKGLLVFPEFLEEGVLALKQYYCVALLDPLNEHAVSAAIDDFWHPHILDTRGYMSFCDRIFGHYIHHSPLDHRQVNEVSHVGRLYRHTSRIYREMFSYINDDFYPVDVIDVDLVCKHYEVENEKVRARALFEKAALVA
jgi:hypothetical protein